MFMPGVARVKSPTACKRARRWAALINEWHAAFHVNARLGIHRQGELPRIRKFRPEVPHGLEAGAELGVQRRPSDGRRARQRVQPKRKPHIHLKGKRQSAPFPSTAILTTAFGVQADCILNECAVLPLRGAITEGREGGQARRGKASGLRCQKLVIPAAVHSWRRWQAVGARLRTGRSAAGFSTN